MTAAAVLTAALQRQLAETPVSALRVGYSGGVDSTVLLACTATVAQSHGVPLLAIHVHHGLLPQADDWAAHARRQAQQLGVELVVERVHVDPRGQGLEAAARRARHAGLQAHMPPGSVLLLAHHQQDQAETVLMRLLRGAALDGVAGMRPLRAFGPGWLARPWLDQPRARLLDAAHELGLRWVEDPSNADLQLDRAWLRQMVWPILLQRFPEAGGRLARFAAQARGVQAVIDTQAAQALAALRGDAGQLSIAGLQALPEGLIGEVLRLHAISQGAPPPGFHELARIRREVIGARIDAEPCLRWQQYEYRRYRDGLYLLPELPPAPTGVVPWPAGAAQCALPEGYGHLQALDAQGRAQPLPQALSVRWRRGGERLKPAGQAHTRELRLLFQERAIPPWQRERIPLVYAGADLLAVPGVAQVDSQYLGGLRIHWARSGA